MKDLIIIPIFLGISLYTKSQSINELSPFTSGFIRFEQNEKLGLMNKDKKIIISPLYENISDVSNGLIQVQLNSKVGFIDTFGTLKIPLNYDIDTLYSIGAYFIKVEGRNSNGELVQTNIMLGIDENFVNFQEGLCAVIKNGRYGFIDTCNNIIIPFIYDGSTNYYNNHAIVKLDKKYGIIDTLGKFKIPCIYDILIKSQTYGNYFAILNGESFEAASLADLLKENSIRTRLSPPLEWRDSKQNH